jgi:hypothetical protein
VHHMAAGPVPAESDNFSTSITVSRPTGTSLLAVQALLFVA